MITFTDRTLCLIPISKDTTKELLNEYCIKLNQAGVNAIEIPIPVYNIMKPLPAGIRFILRINRIEDKMRYPNVDGYISNFLNRPDTMKEIQINDIRELNAKTDFNKELSYRICGLDDAIIHDCHKVFDKLKGTFGNQLNLCPQNDFCCASALAAEWLLSGEKKVTTTLFGYGGYAAFEEVFLALRIAERYKPNLDLSVLNRLKDIFCKLTGETISDNKPVIGKNLFIVEAGIHTDGMSKDLHTYEPYPAEMVGLKRSIIIGKHSGRKSVIEKLKELQLEADDRFIYCILCVSQEKSIALRRSLTDKEFQDLVENCIELNLGVDSCEREKIYCRHNTS